MAQKLNIFTRFLEIWKPAFLKTLLKEKASGPTIKFYLFWSFLLSVVGAVIISVSLFSSISSFVTDFGKDIPEFSVDFKDGILSTTNLTEPYLFNSEGFAIIIDTKSDEYTDSNLDEYTNGILIKSDKVYLKESSVKSRSFSFSEIDKDISFSRNDVNSFVNMYKIYVLIGFIILFSIIFTVISYTITFLTALWWALLVWLIGGLAFKIKGLNYGKSYLLILNFYIIVFLIESIIAYIGYPIYFSTTVIFTMLVGMNIANLKK